MFAHQRLFAAIGTPAGPGVRSEGIVSRFASSLRVTALRGSAFVPAVGSASAEPPSPDPSGFTATPITGLVSQIDVP
ncbi:MAG: hypothetical protein WBL35_04790 [Ornithinibacter sp.]